MTYLLIFITVVCLGFLVWAVRRIATNELPAEPWCECDEHDYGKLELQKGRRFLICKICGYIEDREAEYESNHS